MKIIRNNSFRKLDFFNKSTFLRRNIIGCDVDNNELSEGLLENAKVNLIGKKLVPSKYNIVKSFDKGDMVIFNTLYDSVVILNSHEAEKYQTINKRGYIEKIDIQLYLLGIFIDNKTDEQKLVDFIIEELYLNRNGLPTITILPTQECNAQCKYCFAEHNGKNTMTDKTIDSVIDFFVNNFNPGDKVILRWFGGEPLLAHNIIDKIIAGINNEFGERLLFESVIFTNGSLLTDKLIDNAKSKWHLKKIQLTLDGYDSEHNKRKNYQFSNENYYTKTLKDIEKLLKHDIAVDCRINLDKDNFGQIDNILQDLSVYKDNSMFRARLTILRPSDCGSNEFNYIGPSDLEWAYEIIYSKLFSYGFINDVQSILPHRRNENCIAKCFNKLIIGSDGKLYKCLQQTLDEEHSIGTLKGEIDVNKYVSKYCKNEIHNECYNCVFFPLCIGGCDVYWELQNQNEITPCIREKFFFNMLLDYIYRLQ